MAKNVVLIGAGGHAKVVLDSLDGVAGGFIDDKTYEFFGLKKLEKIGKNSAIISFGSVEPKGLARRHKVFNEYVAEGVKFVSAIHPRAIISPNTKIGVGTLVAPGAIINSGAKIGKNVIINSGAIIEHDAVIGAGSHIAPGAIVLGGAKIGKCCMVGAGAVVLPGAEIADGFFVKATKIA